MINLSVCYMAHSINVKRNETNITGVRKIYFYSTCVAKCILPRYYL